IGDLNGDGHPDLASDYHVYLGHGDGTFDDLGVNQDSTAVMALGDFNGDGREDAVRLGPGPSQLTVALGNGNGTFGPTRAYTTPYGEQGLAVGDLDGDGRSDVSVVAYSPLSTAVFYSNPDGSLGHVREVPTSGAITVNLGDLDGDGALD